MNLKLQWSESGRRTTHATKTPILDGIGLLPTESPEPFSWVMLAAGLAFLMFIRRARRRL